MTVPDPLRPPLSRRELLAASGAMLSVRVRDDEMTTQKTKVDLVAGP